MKCPKQDCNGVMYRFHPEHLVMACYRSPTGVLMELGERRWKQVGLMCDTCGHLEFYAKDPHEVLGEPDGYFERTEPET